MAQVTKHDGEQEGESDDGEWSWIHFPVVGHTVGVDDVLVGRGELVGLVVCWRDLRGIHSIQNRWNRSTTQFLQV